MTTIPLRASRGLGASFLVLGLLLLVLGLLTISDSLINVVLGPVLMLVGVGYLVGTLLVVTPTEVQLRNLLGMTVRRTPIRSLADLRLDDKRLVHTPTGKRVATLGYLFNKADVATLAQALQEARSDRVDGAGPAG